MIRTGYIRWEIEAEDRRSPQDRLAREVELRARPTHRRVVIERGRIEGAAQRFTTGQATYAEVLRASEDRNADVEFELPDVGPHIFRYSASDRERRLAYWMTKLLREVLTFAHEVVRTASSFPSLLVENPALRAGYAKLVEIETLRVIEGQVQPAPTRDDEPLRIGAEAFHQGVPELVAAQLVRDVLEPAEFDEFCRFDRVTVRNGDHLFRVSRRPHALIEVWDAETRRGVTRLCIVFRDPGLPPSDEVVMKYLLAKHYPEMLWAIGVRFPAPTQAFEAPEHRRYRGAFG